MSTATVTDAPAAPAKGKKKLIIIIAAVAALVLAGGGGAAFFLMKKNAADAEAAVEGDEEHAPAKAGAKHTSKADSSHAPIFVPLDPFTVNLADRDAERYAQVGITLEIDEAATGDRLKLYMPAIRNNILMAIADQTAGELLGRDGKAQLAERVRREVSRSIGVDVPEDDEAGEADAAASKKKKKARPPALPVKAVHFSNFIIQ